MFHHCSWEQETPKCGAESPGPSLCQLLGAVKAKQHSRNTTPNFTSLLFGLTTVSEEAETDLHPEDRQHASWTALFPARLNIHWVSQG